ncbi:hypothetical protein F2Q70_00008502 [Brassica cretica]|uniref:Uncharacterized protein n=1 Tax=Brassica cretica TaxID=69181 RepID=A0A8S9M1W5_BRACR|nr:hypothetical protein F2Q70_00008502 [Brassica cretica]
MEEVALILLFKIIFLVKVLVFLIFDDEEGMVLRWEGVMCGVSGDEGEATLE